MLRNCQSRVDIHHFNKVKEQLEVGEELLRGVGSVLVQITGEFFALSGAITILYREVVNLQDVVIVVIGGTTGDIDDKEGGLNFSHGGSLLQESWHHLVWSRFSHDKLLTIVGVAENTCIANSLALIADHVAVDGRLATFERDNCGDELSSLETDRVSK